jgi:hypothetical protein
VAPRQGFVDASYTWGFDRLDGVSAESWSVVLDYSDWAGTFNGTRRSSGKQSGTISVRGGSFEAIDRSGVGWVYPGRNLKSRSLSWNGVSYSLEGNYAFVPAFGATAHGIVFVGCFVVSVPLVDGEELTVSSPPPPWFEGWESAVLGANPITSNAPPWIQADRGRWTIGDTASSVPECSTAQNHVDIVREASRKSLKLYSAATPNGCAQNVWAAIEARSSASPLKG